VVARRDASTNYVNDPQDRAAPVGKFEQKFGARG